METIYSYGGVIQDNILDEIITEEEIPRGMTESCNGVILL
jgi:hypothetical protein